MQKTILVTKKSVVFYCDVCNAEIKHDVKQCAVCNREICNKCINGVISDLLSDINNNYGMDHLDDVCIKCTKNTGWFDSLKRVHEEYGFEYDSIMRGWRGQSLED